MSKRVASASLSEFQKLTPNSTTLVISLTGDSKTLTIEEPNGWGKVVSYKFDVLQPTGPEGSFKDMDEQAADLAHQLAPHLTGFDDIIVQCEYGEIRSVRLASVLAFHRTEELSDYRGTLYEISNGEFVEAEYRYMDRQGSVIDRELRKCFKENKNEQ